MAKYKDFFVDLMMTEELSLPVPGNEGDDTMDALKDSVTMFCSFAAFGMLPIIGFVCAGALVPSLDVSRCAATRGCHMDMDIGHRYIHMNEDT